MKFMEALRDKAAAVNPSSTFPTFTISTSSTLPWRFCAYCQLAAETGASGLELDLTTWVGRTTLSRQLHTNGDAIHSVWLAGLDSQIWNLLPEAGSAGNSHPRNVVVRLPAESLDEDLSIVQSARQQWSQRPWLSGVTIAVPASALDGGRTHLTRLRILNRFLEEWDLDLCLDLNRQTDARWEAEAAILASRNRLKHVRFSAPLHRVVDQRSDVLNRTLASLAETGFAGTLSLTPTIPLWLSWHRTSAIRDLEANRDAVSRIYLERRLALRESYESHLI